jgi:hypothetical protein
MHVLGVSFDAHTRLAVGCRALDAVYQRAPKAGVSRLRLRGRLGLARADLAPKLVEAVRAGPRRV